MIKISKEKYNYYWVKYADVNVGDTFVDDSGNVYIKIPVVFRMESKATKDYRFTQEKVEYNCVSLWNGNLQKFWDYSKVYLINCKMKWDYKRDNTCPTIRADKGYKGEE